MDINNLFYHKKSLVFGFSLIVFISCDPYSHLIYYVENKTSDTLFLERSFYDNSNPKLILINKINYIKIPPNEGSLYFETNIVGCPSDKNLNNEILNRKFKLIKNKDTLDFIFNNKNKCEIKIDGQIGTYTRRIE